MENKKPENPNAFAYGYGTDIYERSESGMSLRDYFAAKAMEALIIHYGVMTTENNHAKESYYMADKMLEERIK